MGNLQQFYKCWETSQQTAVPAGFQLQYSTQRKAKIEKEIGQLRL